MGLWRLTALISVLAGFWILVIAGLVAAAVACEIVPLFSPQDPVAHAIIAEVEAAQRTIHCSLFGISHQGLAGALTDAAARKVEVGVGLDKKQAALRGDLHYLLKRRGVMVILKPASALEHNKFCVIDGQTVVMGSWNWSQRAQGQDNSELILRNCPDAAARFESAYRAILARDRRKNGT
jgi:phosphatidylserine/phosphatidylglycerophosphate/cardiolipin synthase-like enzyme